MPIRPENAGRYPGGSIRSPEWLAIRAAVLERAAHRCEGAPAFPDCRAANRAPHPETGSEVVLTVAHLDHAPENSDPSNLRALCQRCHNVHDAAHRAATRRRTRRGELGMDDLFPETLPNGK